jgi:hypothetical protein
MHRKGTRPWMVWSRDGSKPPARLDGEPQSNGTHGAPVPAMAS